MLVAWFRLVNSTIFGIALFNLFSVLELLSGIAYLTAFETGHLQAQMMLFLNAFNDTWLIGLIFFGLHLLLLGYLIFKSEYVSKILGDLLLLAAFGYLLDSFANFLLPNYAKYEEIFMLIVVGPGVIGELSLTLWLLFKGSKIPEMEAEIDSSQHLTKNRHQFSCRYAFPENEDCPARTAQKLQVETLVSQKAVVSNPGPFTRLLGNSNNQKTQRSIYLVAIS